MRAGVFLLAWGLCAQAPDPAHEPLAQAYGALRAQHYDSAIFLFLKAIEAAPGRAPIRKDLAYVYLKIGENEAAREQFREAMRLDPADFHVALEYAFLCYEGNEKAEARRTFDRVRRAGDAVSRATAEQAFRNVDEPLAAGIARWSEAIRLGGPSFSAHYELARLAEQRDELELAIEHYGKAWRMIPERRYVLVDLGRTWKRLNRPEQGNAALLAASRGSDACAAESARELLPARYPYVPEFRAALALDTANIGLRRELAFLLLRMNRQTEAEEEFRVSTQRDEKDLLSAAQLGFLYLARGDRPSAAPLLDRVLHGDDEELANRVRAVMRMPQVLRRRDAEATQPESTDAREMAERSLRAGYIKDALKYLQAAHEADPADAGIILKLGWTHNLLKQDSTALRWFELARKSPDAQVAAESLRAYRNLKGGLGRFRTSVWMFPFYSSRWRDVFGYGQVRTEARVNAPVRPYISVRFVGDSRGTLGNAMMSPQYLSESSIIGAIGLATQTWHGVTGWAEAGEAFGYLAGHLTPDYRAGVASFRGFGRPLGSERPGWFGEMAADAVYASRFGHDTLFYSQNRWGYTAGIGSLQLQLHVNTNATADVKRQAWANFVEAGPGVRFRWTALPQALYFTANGLRGVHTRNEGNPRRPNYLDFRAGFGYAFSF